MICSDSLAKNLSINEFQGTESYSSKLRAGAGLTKNISPFKRLPFESKKI